VQKAFALYFGDLSAEGDGRGSVSAFPARFFPDENFIGRHSQPGVLAMASSGVHSNGSIFYVTLAKAAHLDGRHVAFGRVLTGMDVLTKIGAGYIGKGQRPAAPVTIVAAGVVAASSPEWAAVDKAIDAAARVAAAAAKAAAAKAETAKSDAAAKATAAAAKAAPAAVKAAPMKAAKATLAA
jgi:cyclophilin family peptidyl-prolyl cis-trans isomerase